MTESTEVVNNLDMPITVEISGTMKLKLPAESAAVLKGEEIQVSKITVSPAEG